MNTLSLINIFNRLIIDFIQMIQYINYPPIGFAPSGRAPKTRIPTL